MFLVYFIMFGPCDNWWDTCLIKNSKSTHCLLDYHKKRIINKNQLGHSREPIIGENEHWFWACYSCSTSWMAKGG
jgi:hypothetical protein